ncbi:MAG TPA: FUSC family protein [Verrucomicrobiae bacterium]|nr:FUSC family protein [Verrucomicrobiae bacterium]
MRDSNVGRAFGLAVVTIAGALASFGIVYALGLRFGAGAAPAILAAALAVGLGRQGEAPDLRRLLFKLATLPLVALAAGAVGVTFLRSPLLGAALFTAAIALSIWLRNYGRRGAIAGRVVALPFVSMLIVPVALDLPGGAPAAAAFAVAAGASASICTTLVSLLARRLGWLEAEQTPRAPAPPKREPRANALPVQTRMAVQMLVALALAFAAGMLALPAHWSWAVLCAFIVCSGALGRGDAIYKGILRFAGAAGGTLAAAFVQLLPARGGVAEAALIFGLLFAGIFLREFNYAYWAGCMTLVFALLQGAQNAGAFELFALRLGGIAIGALCAIAATWFVFPIRTEQIVRRRVADALAAVRTHAHDAALLDYHAQALDRVAPPARLHRRVFGAPQPQNHPAAWIDLAHELLALARSNPADRARLSEKMRELGALLKRSGAAAAKEPRDGFT